ncbi:hypothetical protein B0T24DRAFT_596585 [Lasiosphaeria ovina]|uniref:Uncharacterized protein n=1 Tax=Lasiosphaeria ovina TaxID=92902 RepID=A0AAE0N262_9PEZI|nr:hypothetical protein B0T24DRAFT_596585 [Lasiosphaeria ovina]
MITDAPATDAAATTGNGTGTDINTGTGTGTNTNTGTGTGINPGTAANLSVAATATAAMAIATANHCHLSRCPCGAIHFCSMPPTDAAAMEGVALLGWGNEEDAGRRRVRERWLRYRRMVVGWAGFMAFSFSVVGWS